MQEYRNLRMGKPVDREELRIHIGRSKGRISAKVNVVRYIDNDTKQQVYYIPSLEITGYGETEEKAEEMMWFQLKDWMTYIKNSPASKIQQEISDLGWKKSGLFNKQYSKAYIDNEGKLQNLNAENDHIERLSLTAV